LLIGSVAALFAYFYVNSAQDRAFKGTELVSSLVVTGDVAKGATGDEVLGKELIKTESVPARYRPATAVTDPEAIRGKVAAANVVKGQVLVEGMFVDPLVAQETAAKRVPLGQVAVTVKVDDVTGVAGLITPGDKVNILSKGPDGVERTLFENVNVLYIGKSAAPAPGSTQAVVTEASNLITFAVPPLAAEKIVFASHLEHGIHLTLVHPENKPVPVPPVNGANVYTGGATPYEG
jgi:pilus assembly protein CpaB